MYRITKYLSLVCAASLLCAAAGGCGKVAVSSASEAAANTALLSPTDILQESAAQSSTTVPAETQPSAAPTETTTAQTLPETTAPPTTAAPETTAAAAAEKSGAAIGAADLFTARDKETGYSEETAVHIVLSDGGSTASGGGVTVSGSTVTITAAGTYILSGTLSNGNVIVDMDKEEKLQLVLQNVSISNSSTAPFYIRSADKVFVTLAPGSVNTFTNTGSFTAIDENNIDGCVFSKEDLTFNGSGTLNVSSRNGHGIVCKDSLIITGGNYSITAGDHGIQAKDEIGILDGILNLTCAEDGLHCENDDDGNLGNILIEGGAISISAGDDGIHAGNYVTVNGGAVSIPKSYEGIEGKEVNLNGGTVYVRASDDGINAAGGSDSGYGGFADRFNGTAPAAIRITGGTITVNADGDGVDANGSLSVSGGTLYVSGPTNSGNGALDYDGEASVTGGTVIAAGSTGMAQNFGAGSTQCSILVSVSGGAGSAVTLRDAAGNLLASYTPEKSYRCVVISTPALQVGGSYTVSAGGTDTAVTPTSTIYGGGMGGPGGMMGMDGMNPGMSGGPGGRR